jgi:hypothetical protein
MTPIFRKPRHRGFLQQFLIAKLENREDKTIPTLRLHSEVLIDGSWEDIIREKRIRLNKKERRLYYRRLSRRAKRRA